MGLRVNAKLEHDSHLYPAHLGRNERSRHLNSLLPNAYDDDENDDDD